MANSANPEINKKIATSALGTLVIATVFFYLGDRYAETLVTYPGQIFDHLSDAFLSMWQTIKDAPFALDMTSNSLLFGGACFLIIWMIWLRYVAFIGNYRSGEESGSARWGTLKEGKKFKDLQTEDNNLLFTKNFGLALHRPKFDPEYDRKEIASHSDIEDEDQTVTMHTSEIGTTATDKLDGDKTVIADAESTVTDKVEYDHVLTGKAYTMAGILMDAKTGLPVLTGEGAKKYTEDDLTKFTSGLMNVLGFQSNTYSIKVKDKDWGNGAAIVKNADGSYTYDASERTENEDGTWTVKTDTQTLTEQEDGTWKLTGLEGSGSATADGGTSFVRNIEETYKADEVEVTDNGIDWSNAKKLPTASIDLAKVKAYAEENKDLLSCLVYKTAEFTPEKESGSIDMDYTFNSNDVIDRLSGETKNLVVFEVMFKGSIENASDETPVSIVASECDKDNEGQTVKLAPSTIGTTATDKSDGDHELMAGKDAVITDEVKYEGLIPGKEYTLHATLMDKKTGEPLKVADKGVTAELKFTPNSESGTVSINLGEFDATSLDGHTLVVFEELTKQSDIDGKATDVTVAEHKDINDEGQSVTVTSTPAGSTYGKTGVDMTNIAIAIGILLIAAGCATAYGIKSRKTTKGDADENAEDNTEA